MQRPHLWSNSHCILSRNPLGKSISHLLTSSKFLLIKQQGTFEGLGKTKKKHQVLIGNADSISMYSQIYIIKTIFIFLSNAICLEREAKRIEYLCAPWIQPSFLYFTTSLWPQEFFFLLLSIKDHCTYLQE